MKERDFVAEATTPEEYREGAASPSGPREALSGEAASPAAGLPTLNELAEILVDAEEGDLLGPDYTPGRLAQYILARLSRSGGEAPPEDDGSDDWHHYVAPVPGNWR